jgi:hypothetical protein
VWREALQTGVVEILEAKMTNMKEFNPKEHCPKCGCKKINMWYCNNPTYKKICENPLIKREHLHMGCMACHYEWLMKCKDDGRPK